MKLLRMMQEFRDLDPELPMQTAYVFLLVAEAGLEIRQNELLCRSGMSASALSRSISSLDKWSWLKRPGLNLVRSEPDLMDRRKRLLRLTKEGHALFRKLKEIEGWNRGSDDKEADDSLTSFVAASLSS
jgi:DNA-binding MarR family transcriptional regulator